MIYKLPDGYIEIRDSGNTYCGRIAHNIRHKASQVHRDCKKDMSEIFQRNVEIDYNKTLLYILKEFIKEMQNEKK
jgi:hypothetical protein